MTRRASYQKKKGLKEWACVRCGVIKDYTQFSPHNKYRDGAQEYHSECAECGSLEKSRSRYGIDLTKDAYKLLLKKQGYHCAICNNGDGTKNLAIDHDHQTGKIRGLLCTNCNLGLGLYKDSPVLLRSAAKYLDEA